MDDSFTLSYEQLKISAFSKVRKINNCVKDVTIGPNSSKKCEVQLKIPPKKDRKCEINNAPLSNNALNNTPVHIILKKIENERQVKVKKAVGSRVKTLEEFSKKQCANGVRQWIKMQEDFAKDMQKQESFIVQALDEYDKNISNEHSKLVQHYQDLAERRRLQEKELEAKEKQRLIMNAWIDKIRKSQQEFRFIYQEIIPIIKTCTNNEELKNLMADDMKLLKTLPDNLEEITVKCRTGKISEDDIKTTSEIIIRLTNLKTKISTIVNQINTKKATEEDNLKKDISQQSASISTNQSVNSKQENKVEDKPSDDGSNLNLAQYISLPNLKMYLEIMDFFDKHKASFKKLEDDNSQKEFRSDCKKAINIPVNSLSGVNSEHILDKYNRLHRLLNGENVLVGDKRLNASSHPQGIAFCMDLLAKKFVLQGDLMVSSNPDSAFCYATVIVSLWNDFPIFGQLILAYFYKYCPCIVPYYVPREIGESDEQYYVKQGYCYTNGQIERQDKFLKRMTGIMRLYSAVLIVKPKRGQTTNKHNLQHGWRWLSSVLKLEPRVDITATVLHTFLETAGFEMNAKYGNVFDKLMTLIIEKFLPFCREKCTGGAITRLELLLTEYIKNRKFTTPNGYIGYCYW